MAIKNWFKKEDKQHPLASAATEYYFGANVKASGSLNTHGDIYFDGELKGDISSPTLVELGENSQLNGFVKSRSVIFEGSFKGNAEISEEAKVVSCAKVKGEIKSSVINIEKGAIVDAKITTEEA